MLSWQNSVVELRKFNLTRNINEALTVFKASIDHH